LLCGRDRAQRRAARAARARTVLHGSGARGKSRASRGQEWWKSRASRGQVAGKFCGTFFVKMLKLARNLPVPAKIASGKKIKNRVFSAKTQDRANLRKIVLRHKFVFSVKKRDF
jgi:hypothetical protein